MTLYSGGSAVPEAITLEEIDREVRAFAPDGLEPWESDYLKYHKRRFQDTVTLLGDGGGRRLLDVGTFPGHLAALAGDRGWEVAGLNSDIESGSSYEQFLGRCAARRIAMHTCEVERDRFPFQPATFDAVLLAELFEHLCFNPFHTLREIFRVLRPGGVLVLTTPNAGRIETFARLLHGWGYQAPVSRPFRELLPSLLHHRHNREYTGNELRYFLSLQGKDLYDFTVERLCHSDCLGAGAQVPGVLGRPPGRIESALTRWLQRLLPSLHGQIMIRAVRSAATFVPWEGIGGLEGLGASREDELPHQGFTRRVTFPLRPPGSRVAFEVPIPPGEGPALVSLMAAHLGPEGAPTLHTRWRANGHRIMACDFRPSPRGVRVRLLLPSALAAEGRARLELETDTWDDPLAGGPAGPHLGGPGLIVERLPSPAAIAAAVERMHAGIRAEEDQVASLAAAQSLVLADPGLRPALDIGPGDRDQLGGDWFPPEPWGRWTTWVRWTGQEAMAYLAGDRRASAAHVLVCPGDRRLGPAAGELAIAYTPADGFLTEGATVPFTLAEDRWTTVSAPLSGAVGTVVLTLRFERPRIPRELIPGSADDRPLGVAVRRLWLA